MVLIALMTSFAVPALRTAIFADQMKTATRKILGLVAEASQEAVGSNAGYALRFDLEQNTVEKVREGRPPGGLTETASPVERQLTLPEAVRLLDVESVHGGRQAQGEAVIRFSRKGYVDKTLIHLRSEEGEDMTIMLSPFLGVTKIFDSYVELTDDRVRY